MPDAEAATGMQGAGWRPGMPTRCGRCLSDRIAYTEEGGARCLACGHVTSPSWAPPVRVLEEPRPDLSATGGVGVSAGSVVLDTRASRYAPGASASYPYRTPRSRREDHLIQLATVAVFLGIVWLVVGVPGVLYFYPEPVIHMTDYYIDGDSSCNLVQHLTLTNTGARGGFATVTFFVDHVPFMVWVFPVGAHTSAAQTEPVYVSDCMIHVYGIYLDSVRPV